MSQNEIIGAVVSSYQKDPRNKIIIDAKPLVAYASEELGSQVTASQLAEALGRYESGEPSDEDQNIVDAATSLCHQVANCCWGECTDQENDEWSEVDIATEWSNYDGDGGQDLFVAIHQG